MPELPEVESLAKELRRTLLGARIQRAWFDWPRTIAGVAPNKFASAVSRQTILDVSRRGKYIVFSLQREKKGASLIFHLRMSGRMFLAKESVEPEKHDRFRFFLDDRRVLFFRDPRKFGRVYFVSHEEEVLHSLGPEPLSKEFSLDHLARILSRSKMRIKPLLLNQRFVAGLGNIYVDEALWRACLHPERRASSLSKTEVAQLRDAVRSTIREAIKKKGTDFGDGVVPGGKFSPQAYGRTGEPCHRCESAIERIVVAQRGTHFCPRCQK
ncbi:MAG: bifunctional DNA-formamidopyrimidine glycosylase/DNA-(apurinic or apyrimidinic site) lyase [Bdellovibrionales bacterium]|nr:bifunctional DNA-formamidopyrimidine glycosylase/DNA-(apurinic or apyrimidinic site) lyase [Bdellovibrionales bacterium]